MQKKYFFLTAAGLVLIVLLGFYIYANLPQQGHKYSVKRNGVEFVSNDGNIGDLIEGMRGYSSFTVAPRLVRQGPENSYMASGITLFNTVLAAKRKDVVVAARLIDENGSLSGCQSNLGNVKVNKEISAEECTRLLEDTTSARIFIELPDTKLAGPRIVLENGVARIYPSSFESVSGVSFEFASALYPDAAGIIAQVNGAVAKNS